MSKKDKKEAFFSPKKTLGFNDEIKVDFLPELDEIENSVNEIDVIAEVLKEGDLFNYIDSCFEIDEYNRLENFVRTACEALEKQIIVSKKPNNSEKSQVTLRPKDIRSILMDFCTSVNVGNCKNVQLSRK